jgi:hypothetical protein
VDVVTYDVCKEKGRWPASLKAERIPSFSPALRGWASPARAQLRLILLFILTCEEADCQYSNHYTEAENDTQCFVGMFAHSAIRRFGANHGSLFHLGDSGFEQIFSVLHDGLDVVQELFEVNVMPVSALSHGFSISIPQN